MFVKPHVFYIISVNIVAHFMRLSMSRRNFSVVCHIRENLELRVMKCGVIDKLYADVMDLCKIFNYLNLIGVNI